MTPNEEREVLDGVREIRAALLGTINGDQEGALHKLNRLHEDFYHPEEPQESIHNRVKRLEGGEIKRGAVTVALSLLVGFVGFVISNLVVWLSTRMK